MPGPTSRVFEQLMVRDPAGQDYPLQATKAVQDAGIAHGPTTATSCGGECGISSPDLRDHCGRPASAARRKTSPHVRDRIGERSARVVSE